MEKGINLQAKLHVGTDPAAVSHLRQSLPDLFAQTNPGLKLSVKKVSEPDSDGDTTMRVYIEGDQDPAADFAALTRGALNKTIAAYNSGGSASGIGAIAGSEPSAAASMGAAAAGQTGVHIKDLKEMEGDEEDTGVTLAPQAPPQAPSPAPSAETAGAAPDSPAAAPSQPPIAAPSSASSSPPTASQTTQAEGRPWWAFWRRTN